MIINKIGYKYANNSVSSLPFGQRIRIDQNKKKELPLVQLFQYGTSSADKMMYTKDIIAQLSSDGIDVRDKTYDSFTGLRDKNYLLAVLGKTIENSQKTNKGLSIAMFDMDNFKSINELLGYETGDNFIKVMSDNVAKTSSNHGVSVYRFGGDEFVMIFNGETLEKRNEIVSSIVKKFRTNKYINSMSEIYNINAHKKLAEYTVASSKIQEVTSLKAQKKILDDLYANFETESAKKEPYFVKQVDLIDKRLNKLYFELLSDSSEKEQDEQTKNWLLDLKNDVLSGKTISEPIQGVLDEYLYSVYDKSHEIYQIKKWIRDFDSNKGFSMTAAIADYTPQMLQDKTPIGIINEIGEHLKQGKQTKKGRNYFPDV